MMSGRPNRSGRKQRIRIPGGKRSSVDNPAMRRDRDWLSLEKAIETIFQKKSAGMTFEAAYRMAYNLTTSGHIDFLLDGIERKTTAWLESTILPSLKNSISGPSCSLLFSEHEKDSEEKRAFCAQAITSITNVWDEYVRSSSMLSDVCMYVNRVGQQENRDISTMVNALRLFRDKVLLGFIHEEYSLYDIVSRLMLDEILREREGRQIDEQAVASCTYMLLSLTADEDAPALCDSYYVARFQPTLISETNDFYDTLGAKLLETGNVPAWVEVSCAALQAEKHRCKTYLQEATTEHLVNSVKTRLVSKYMSKLICNEKTGLAAMIDRQEFTNIHDLYSLDQKLDNSTVFKTAIQNKVHKDGIAMQAELKAEFDAARQADAVESQGKKSATAQRTQAAMIWVHKVVQLEAKFDEIVNESCKGDFIIAAEVGKGFSRFINNHSRATEFLSVYIDDCVNKVQSSGLDQSGIYSQAMQIVRLIRYLEQKDEFQSYYQRHMARRLLAPKAEQSRQFEIELVSNLKKEFGSNFTKNFEKMVNDLTLSSSMASDYTSSEFKAKDTSGIDFSVQVLTNGSWPVSALGGQESETQEKEDQNSEDPMDCRWPAEVKPAVEAFTAFYGSLHESRVLRWCSAAAFCDMTCRFPAVEGKSALLNRPRRYEINMPVFGMRVLLLFNGADAATEGQSFEQIREITGMGKTELMKTMFMLSANPKCRLLNKSPETKAIKPEDKFTWNPAFINKSIRVKLRLPQTSTAKVETDTERHESEKKQEGQRKFAIDAAIVRVMKQRKTMLHGDLITEVIKQVSGQFVPEVSLIKKQIETLMDRDYMERDDEGGYRYLA